MNTNPFGVPNFSQLGDSSSNPLLRSMDMMAQSWKNMAAGGSAEMSAAMLSQLNPEELDRRIRDMRAVESWLQLNLSMLGASIQALEIQRSTLNTLQSLAQASGQVNPFDAVMKMNPLAAAGGAEPPKTGEPPASAEPEQAAPADVMAEAGAAAQGWWNMLQQQFESLAQSSLKQAEQMRQSAEAGPASADSHFGPRSPLNPAASQATAKTAATKPTAAKRATKTVKTAAKKAAVKSSTKK